jgi:hypothetical protein
MAQTASGISQPASPGESPQHWGTKSFSAAAATFFAVAVVALLIWRFLLKGVRVNLGVRVLVYFSEAAAAVGLSLVVTYFDVFKKTTYVPTPAYQPDWHVIFWASAWAALVAYYFTVKLVAILTKESEEFKSKELASELDRVKVAVASVARQRTFLVKVTSFARSMVNKKIRVLAPCCRHRHLHPSNLLISSILDCRSRQT